MKCESMRQGNVLTLTPCGLLAGADVDDVQAVLGSAVTESSTEIIIDASGIIFVDSKGLEMLLEAAEHVIQNGKTLKVAGANANLREVLEITELAPLFRFHETALEALEGCL